MGSRNIAGISTLAPHTPKAERNKVRATINKVIRQAAREYAGGDLLEHVYLAGLWHGSQLAEKMEQPHG